MRCPLPPSSLLHQCLQPWKICAWHKNQRSMQIGSKVDETGWETYEMCAHHGAIVHTGHEHSYCRSKTMSSFQNPRVLEEDGSNVTLDQDSSFVFVSGLAGYGIRSWREELISNPWWASYAARNNDVNAGVLYCTFNVNGRENLAECWFQDIDRREWDRFTITTNLRRGQPIAPKRSSTCELESLQELTVAGQLNDAVELPSGAVLCDAQTIDVEVLGTGIGRG